MYISEEGIMFTQRFKGMCVGILFIGVCLVCAVSCAKPASTP